MRAFFALEAQAMLSRFEAIQTLLPDSRTRGASHRGEEGRYLEALVRDFLNKHLPNDIRAVSGFILKPSTKTGQSNTSRVRRKRDQHSSQLDIIVYDFAGFPTYEAFEEVHIVPPEGVVAVISVKKTLRKSDLEGELRALHHAATLCHQPSVRGPFTALFAFRAEKTFQVALPTGPFDKLVKFHAGHPFGLMVSEVSVLDDFVWFKFRKGDTDIKNSAKYVHVECRGRPYIPLERLLQSILSVFHDKSRGSRTERPGFVSFEKGTFELAPCIGHIPFGPDPVDELA